VAIDIKKIKDQRLSLLLADFHICRNCRVVDRDQDRIRFGHECSACGASGEGGLMYFELSVLVLIDLMQEAFLTPSGSRENRSGSTRQAHNVSVVLFFCTFREILLNWLIDHLCWAQKIPKPVCERLLSDSNTYALRQNNLLPSLTGKKWKSLATEESLSSQLDYVELDEFMRKAVEARNKFMHEGKRWGIDRNLAQGCIDHIGPLLNFYVALHNRYVHPLHLVSKKP
jgi:hypothetical protein